MQVSAIEIPRLFEKAELPEETAFWLATLAMQDGQAVQQGQALARVEGKEFSQDLVSPQDGFVVGLHALPGQIVHAGQILCYICSQPSIPTSPTSPRLITHGVAIFDPTALIIFGGGGHGKAVIDLVRAMGTYRIVGVFDDGLPAGSEVLGVPVLGGASDLSEWHNRGIRLAANAVGGIGNVAVRLKIFEILANAGFVCPALVHPSAVIERSATLEAGVQVLPQAYVGSAARVGFGTVINAGAVISHDCVLGRVVNLSPGATLAGNVRVDDHAQIGMRATVNLQITVGEGALLGNGCTVKANVPPGMRVRAGTIWPAPKEEPKVPKE
jgi:sugar O-acyltransferase (sialic acid O-acetyltransferase NeuD family)